ncbi:CHAT domain-containing protein [Amycolatopsis mediterranei]|uniref:CHAT domain-containing protein n=1 Tax=Amycolatopsis mediterranei TaxID=33910 RepID=UPI001E3AFE7A|nr:CHAT domain-containing protein [Amycolatopsis mediterranei]UZF70571.1 CHAT domain-containing protein [Amycolatopsis mediterranei]
MLALSVTSSRPTQTCSMRARVMAMAVDLELGLVWDNDQENFEVNLRMSGPESLDQMEFLRHAITIDADALRAAHADEDEYGARLTGMIFSQPKIEKYYRDAIRAAGTESVHFRIHLNGPARFHQVRWESLRAPGKDGRPIATSGNVLLSRYLSGENWPLIPSKPFRERRALIVVAAPADVEQYKDLAPVDRAAEVARATSSLADYRSDVLGHATLDEIIRRMEKTPYEVLYLVAHGWLTEDVPRLLLENADGNGDVVDARRLAERVHAMAHKPTLAMLVSCQSADPGENPASADSGALAGLGPRLSEAGIPAVVAMQGNIAMATAEKFVKQFFDVFKNDAAVDVAMAKARAAVRTQPDWWAPVLFSRLRSGRAYHKPEFTTLAGETWDDLKLLLERHRVTPVLGPGLADGILGTRAEIARRWALRWQMPIAWHGRSNLAQVAQFLRVTKKSGMVPHYLTEFLMTDLLERVETAGHDNRDDPFVNLPSRLLTGSDPVPIIQEVGKRMRSRDAADPYRVAAALKSRIFVTTGWTGLLQDALQEAGFRPRTMCYPWYPESRSRDIEGVPLEAWPPPTVEEPWVCHLFGRLAEPESLVLTEDDYFAWLSAWIGKRNQLPETLSELSTALSVRPLLFVGYQLRDWDFQVLFQGIQNFGGQGMLNNLNVGVQLMPEVDVIEPEAAQRYLESALKDVRIFWSDTKTFMKTLREKAELET